MRFEYPLQWLKQQKRTSNPQRARFGNHSPSKAGDYLIQELERLGAKNCIISSNLEQRSRGDGFYANQKVDDNGSLIEGLCKNDIDYVLKLLGVDEK